VKSFEQQHRSPLRDKSFRFAVEVVRLSQQLVQEQKEFVLSKQILRSGTSIGANVREASYAESKKDFIHKLSIALKECDETLYWLDLLYETEGIQEKRHASLAHDALELHRILSASIQTARQSLSLQTAARRSDSSRSIKPTDH
jgi:four helix bundle protein